MMLIAEEWTLPKTLPATLTSAKGAMIDPGIDPPVTETSEAAGQLNTTLDSMPLKRSPLTLDKETLFPSILNTM
jgi:hypothetical protein